MKPFAISTLLLIPTTIALLFPASSIAQACSEVTSNLEKSVTFKSGNDTLYGTLLMPDITGIDKMAGVLIISGSGPTDRNGNGRFNPHLDTNCNFARTLGQLGFASFRYDKLYSGKTGVATHVHSGYDNKVFEKEAMDTYLFLSQQPQIDSKKLMVLGHSEGGLYALRLSHLLRGQLMAPWILILAAPLSTRYLDLAKRQLTSGILADEKLGTLSSDQAKALTEELSRLVTQLRAKGTIPKIVTPRFTDFFYLGNEAFLQQADIYDPAELAATLPTTPELRVLILRGSKDVQVTEEDVDHLMSGFSIDATRPVQATRMELQDTDHIFKTVLGAPNPVKDYADLARPFSPQAIKALEIFLKVS